MTVARLPMPIAHALCLGLVAADQLTKTWRIQALARGLGYHMGFRYVFTVNVASDAAASLTPLRFGGEPVRVTGIMQGGLSVSDTIALITVEGAMEYATVIAIAIGLGWAYGAEWWETARAHLVPAGQRALPWLALILVAGFVVVWMLRRWTPRLFLHVHGTLRDSVRNARRMARWTVLLSLPLTIIHVVARIAVLPVLLSTLADPPPLGPVWVGSFALLYGQLFLPTPAGAGAVDLGFVNGATGDATAPAARLLLVWRFYTTVTGVILGLVFGVPHYTGRMSRWLLRRRAARTTLDNPRGD